MRKKTGALFFLGLMFIGLSARGEEPSGPDATYLDAERLYLKSDTKGAVAKINQYFQQDAGTRTAQGEARAHNLKGLIFFQAKNLTVALEEFEAAVMLASKSGEKNDPVMNLARYNLGNALYQSGKAQESYEVLSSVEPSALDADTRMRFHHLLGNISINREEYFAATGNYLMAANLAKDDAMSDTYVQKAYNASRKLYFTDPQKDLARLRELELPSGSAGALGLKVVLARGFLYAGDSSSAEKQLNDFLSGTKPTNPLRPRAQEMLMELSKLSEVEPNTIGLLLPLSGKFAKFGRLCMNAAFQSLHIFEDMPEKPGTENIRFAIEDSGDTPESAQAAFERLVMEDKAIGVVGPLLSKQFSSVAQKAQEFGVPIMSLSQRIDSARAGSYIFPMALTPNQQIEMVVEQAIEKEGYKRFAILAPSDSFGNEYVKLFWDEVEKRGGSIVGIERYEPKSTDFRDEVNKLVGLAYPDARSLESEEIRRRRDQYASTLKVKGKLRERLLKQFDLKAAVDFDALFIPDDPQTIGQIAPAFAVKEVEGIPLLGINTWNTNEIIQRAGRYLQKSLFVDAYFAGAQDEKTAKFSEEFSKNFQTVPGTIEVQTYDAATLLIKAIMDGHPNSRAKLRDQLLAGGRYEGISGDFVFSDSGVKRTASLLTVKGNSIVPVVSSALKTLKK